MHNTGMLIKNYESNGALEDILAVTAYLKYEQLLLFVLAYC